MCYKWWRNRDPDGTSRMPLRTIKEDSVREEMCVISGREAVIQMAHLECL